jgi:hypothetical protein
MGDADGHSLRGLTLSSQSHSTLKAGISISIWQGRKLKYRKWINPGSHKQGQARLLINPGYSQFTFLRLPSTGSLHQNPLEGWNRKSTLVPRLAKRESLWIELRNLESTQPRNVNSIDEETEE